MKLTVPLAALAAAASLAFAVPATAANPELEIPDFSHLRQKASDTVDITIGSLLLNIASRFAAHDGNADEGLKLLRDITSVRVRNYEFDSDGAYSQADIEAVRRQLAAPGWTALAQVRKRDHEEDVDVYVCAEEDRILGLAVIASQPRSFTIVNIIGNIDVDKLAKLEGQFGIPKTSHTD